MSDQHPPENLVRLDDPAAGLRGFIVVHSTALGPAAGGCRFWRYGDDTAAGADALRLAAGMTMKNALAGLPLGGGKAVLMPPDGPFSRTALFHAFGRAVEALGGAYLIAEDVGTNIEDMVLITDQTAQVAGLSQQPGRAGGDASPWTARRVFCAMEVAVERRLGRRIDEVKVAVQGVGHVGLALCELLHLAGARLVVAEPRAEVVASVAAKFGAQVVPSDEIAQTDADVFAPCALGGVFNDASLSSLKATVICGAANNLLASPELGDVLAERGVLYAPDYLVNAGGIINVAAEHLGWSEDEVAARVNSVALRLHGVLDLADQHRISPARAADMAAREVIQSARTGSGRVTLAA